jgi:hypothetical protein
VILRTSSFQRHQPLPLTPPPARASSHTSQIHIFFIQFFSFFCTFFKSTELPQKCSNFSNFNTIVILRTRSFQRYYKQPLTPPPALVNSHTSQTRRPDTPPRQALRGRRPPPAGGGQGPLRGRLGGGGGGWSAARWSRRGSAWRGGWGWQWLGGVIGKSVLRRSEWCKFEFDWLGIGGVTIQNVGRGVFFCGGRVAVVGWQCWVSLERAC